MENKGTKIFIIGALALTVVCLTVAYAVLSQTLSVKGTAEVEGGTWDVHFGSVSKTEHGATATYNAGATSITNMEVEFHQPGDYVEITIPVENKSSFAAKLNEVQGKDTALSFEGTSEDIAKVQSDVKYTVKYESQEIKSDTDISKLTGNSLAASSGTATIILRAEYVSKSTAQEMPQADVKVKGFDRTFVFGQA